MDKKILLELYEKKRLSMMEIAHTVGVTHPTVCYWMKKYSIKRRNRSESIYVKQNPNGDPFKIKKTLTVKEKLLLLSGLMVYWAEGNKKNKEVVQLGNLDCRMLKLFLRFLRQICTVKENRIALYVRVHEKFSQLKAKDFWARYLPMLKERIFVYPHGDKRSKFDKQWSEFGIATPQVSNTKLKKWLDNEIDRHVNRLA